MFYDLLTKQVAKFLFDCSLCEGILFKKNEATYIVLHVLYRYSQNRYRAEIVSIEMSRIKLQKNSKRKMIIRQHLLYFDLFDYCFKRKKIL